MLAPPVQYTQTNDGVAIAYSVYGEGPPLVVSTGPMVPLDFGWQEDGLWQQLGQSFQVVRFDPRGCGLSERDGVWGSFHDEAMDIAAVIDAIGAARVVLLGYFIGTAAAVIHALNDPERVSHLLLHHPVPMGFGPARSDDLQAQDELFDETIDRLLRLGWRYDSDVARRALIMIVMPKADDATIRRVADALHTYPSVERLLQLIPELRALDLRDELRALDMPTLISVAHQDTASGRAWAQAVSGAQLALTGPVDPVIDSQDGAARELANLARRFVRGADAAPTAPLSATRTVVFTDLEGSTDLIDRLGDHAAREVTRQLEQITRSALQSHGGTEVKTMGDGFMAWFTTASAALDAAVDIERAVDQQLDLRVRIGINAGEPIAEADDLYGATVNRAARIMDEAGGGEIFVSDLVRGLVLGRGYRFDDRGRRELRGFEEPVQLFALDWRAQPA